MTHICLRTKTAGWGGNSQMDAKVYERLIFGSLPLHASTVGLVRNLQNGNINPQFHLVFDDYFETMHTIEDQ